MTTIQTVIVGVLWILVLGLGGLVLILYRQVDRVTDKPLGDVKGSLLAGVEAPDIELIDNGHVGTLDWAAEDELMLLAFVSTSCDGCIRLLGALREFRGERPAVRVAVLAQGETNTIFEREREGVGVSWIAHAADIVRDYGVNVVPLVYALRGRTVLGSGYAATVEELNGLLTGARDAAAALDGPSASVVLT